MLLFQLNSLSGIENLKQLSALNIASTNLVADSILVLRQATQLTSLDLRNTLQVVGDVALKYLDPSGAFFYSYPVS